MARQPPVSEARLPKNYALLREIVRGVGRGRHQTASDIYLEARRRQPTIGLATVHRGLARLCELGEVAKIDVARGESAWYELPAPTHAHLLCERCNAVVDVDYATPPSALRSVAERAGVHIAGESLTFSGLCARCVTATRPSRGRRTSATPSPRT